MPRSKADLARAKAAAKGKPVVMPTRGPRFSQRRDDLMVEIVRMMNACEWVPGQSQVDLSLKHGITRSAVREVAGEASRHIRLCLDSGDARAEVLAGIRLGIRKALTARLQQYDQAAGTWRDSPSPSPNLTALHKFLQLEADVHGLTPRADAASAGEGGSVELPMDELSSMLAQAGYEVTKKDRK